MARILSIDYGTKRTGIAVTDPLQIIGSPLQTVETNEIITFLEKYFKTENVETIVVGDPKKLDNTPADLSREVISFVNVLEEKFPDKKIVLVDERFTSKMAQQALISSGLKKKDRRDKSLLDKISAAVILQHYLETIKK